MIANFGTSTLTTPASILGPSLALEIHASSKFCLSSRIFFSTRPLANMSRRLRLPHMLCHDNETWCSRAITQVSRGKPSKKPLLLDTPTDPDWIGKLSSSIAIS